MRFLPKPGFAGLICVLLIGGMLVSADRLPSGIHQAAVSRTPTGTSALATPTQTVLTPTPPPATLRPTNTPVPLPPPAEIGSTDGIITWGVLMVALILAALLWHRPDWARRRPPANPTGRT